MKDHERCSVNASNDLQDGTLEECWVPLYSGNFLWALCIKRLCLHLHACFPAKLAVSSLVLLLAFIALFVWHVYHTLSDGQTWGSLWSNVWLLRMLLASFSEAHTNRMFVFTKMKFRARFDWCLLRYECWPNLHTSQCISHAHSPTVDTTLPPTNIRTTTKKLQNENYWSPIPRARFCRDKFDRWKKVPSTREERKEIVVWRELLCQDQRRLGYFSVVIPGWASCAVTLETVHFVDREKEELRGWCRNQVSHECSTSSRKFWPSRKYTATTRMTFIRKHFLIVGERCLKASIWFLCSTWSPVSHQVVTNKPAFG